jgi:hypothetical protein
MSLWRATVDPLRNMGEPISAEWEYPGDIPNTAYQNRSSIRQPVDRYMLLEYDGGGWGYWTPGEAVESVYYPSFPEGSNQSWHPDIPDASQPFEVYHSTSIPLGTGYNSQYIPPIYYDMDSASVLVDEVLHDITQHLYGKGKRYIKRFVKRYFVTPTISDEFTAEAAKTGRYIIATIFFRANSEPHDQVEVFVEDEWARLIRNDETFSFIFFNDGLYEDDRGVKLFNKHGKSLKPANKAELRRGVADGTQYTPRFNPSPTSPSRKNIRKRTQRKRDKKLIKEQRALLESIKDNPDLMYGDDESDRLHLDKMKRLGEELKEKVNDKTEKSELIKRMYGHFGGLRATRRRIYKRTTRKFRGKKQINNHKK